MTNPHAGCIVRARDGLGDAPTGSVGSGWLRISTFWWVGSDMSEIPY